MKNLFGKKNDPIKSYADFWNWFQQNEKLFAKSVKQQNNIERNFFDKIAPKLNEIKPGIFFLTGMLDDNTIELILTPDGNIVNFVFVEELIDAAPAIEGWQFTALKPALNADDLGINMAGYEFDNKNLSFYANVNSHFPDEINLTVVHTDLNRENKEVITNGTYIFLDNYLGELKFATCIDNISIISKSEANGDLIPINKLKDFLTWREKEFLEKYDVLRYDTTNDNYSGLEAELENGMPLIAIINTTLLKWDRKASHPWIMNIKINYEGRGENGMPDQKTYQLMHDIEDQVMEKLKDTEGYLNIGRETADFVRDVYFACKDFRLPSKIMNEIQSSYEKKIDISFEIYKDKYWKSFDRFIS